MARSPIHPGEILAHELEEIGLTMKSWPTLSRCHQTASTSFWRESGTSPRTLPCASVSISACRLIFG